MTHELDKHIKIGINEMTVSYVEGESRAERALSLSQKLVARENLHTLGEFLRMTNRRIAYTSGAFDVIHKGHTRYLNLAKSLGDVLVVGLNSDSSIRGYKGPDRPILGQNDRAEMLSFLGSVDYITIYDEPAGDAVIKLLKPNAYLCVEGSWEGDIASKSEVIAMNEVEGHVYYTPRQGPTISTSNIIEIIGERYGKQAIDDYKKMMGNGQNGNQ